MRNCFEARVGTSEPNAINVAEPAPEPLRLVRRFEPEAANLDDVLRALELLLGELDYECHPDLLPASDGVAHGVWVKGRTMHTQIRNTRWQ